LAILFILTTYIILLML